MPYLQTPFSESQGRLSPDGKWMAYASDESSRFEVYVQSMPASGGKWQISTAGGTEPRWRRDRKEMFYRSPDGKMMAVDIKAGASFAAGVPKPLFDARFNEFFSVGGRYDVTADGQRFLINVPAASATDLPITIVSNWTATLKQ